MQLGFIPFYFYSPSPNTMGISPFDEGEAGTNTATEELRLRQMAETLRFNAERLH
jgi:hypothetical protein